MSRTLADFLKRGSGTPLSPLTQTLKRTSPSGASYIFDTIDTYTGAKPVREYITGRKNVSGYDLLEQKGLLTGHGFLDVPLGIGAEMLLDPTTYLTGGASGVGRAGRAARAAGLLDDAPRLFSRAAINAGKTDDLVRGAKTWNERIFGGGLLDSVGTRAKKTYDKLGFDVNKLSDSDLAVRPLVGRRQAMRDPLPTTGKRMTLNDLVNAAPDSQKAMTDVGDFLRNKNVQQVLDSPVYKDLSFDIPFSGGGFGGIDIPGGGGIAQAFDRVGDVAKQSWVGRRLASTVDKGLLNTVEPEDQLLARRLTNADKAANPQATKRMSELIRSIDPELIRLAKDPENGRYIKAAIEGNEKFLETLYKNVDQFKKLKNHREFDSMIQKMRKFYQGYLDDSAEAGVRSAGLTDPFGNLYSSRRIDRKLFKDAKDGGIATNKASVITGDMQQRSPEFNIPGGTGMLNSISRAMATDPDLQEATKLTSYIMDQVKQATNVLGPAPAQPVMVGGKTVMKSPEYSDGMARELANKLLNMDMDEIENGRFLFDENPFEAMDKYASGRSSVMSRAGEVQSMLAQTARRGGGGVPMNSSIEQLGMASTYGRPHGPKAYHAIGANKNIMDSINSLVGKNIVQNVGELGKWSTNRELQRRIKNVATFYDEQPMQGDMFKFISGITKNFKVWALATPRRSVRDWYSGLFSNFITHPDVKDQWHGYSVAKRAIIEQDWEGARSLLEKIPRYERIKNAGGDVIKAAQDDLALVDMAQTGKLRDIDPSGNLLGGSETEVFDKYLGGDGKAESTIGYQLWDNTFGGSSKAGVEDVSVVKGAKEFLGNKGSLVDEMTPFESLASGDFKLRSEYTNVKNPILRTSARTAEVSDKINRMGGYFAMLTGGYSPEAAAKAITEAQIDYSSLTTFERNWLQMIFPFWSYQSRIVKWGAKQMYERNTFKNVGLRTPMRIGESFSEEGELAPSRIAERYGVPMPDIMQYVPDSVKPYLEPLLGQAVPGVDVWLSDIDIAFVDSLNTISPVVSPNEGSLSPINNFFGRPDVSISKTGSKTFQNIAGSMLNPLSKFGIEQATGKDLFTKQPLDATRRSAATVAGRLGAGVRTQETIGSVEPIITAFVPGLNHPLSIGRKVSSPKGTTAQNTIEALLNISSGVKVERIGPEERTRDMRQKIQNYLEQSPFAREMSIPYIPKDYLEDGRIGDAETMKQLLLLDKQLQKKQRELKERRLNNPLLTP